MKWSKKDTLYVGMMCLILLAIAGATAYVSFHLKDYDFARANTVKERQIPGPRGKDGETTTHIITSYLPGEPGKDAPAPTDEQVQKAVNNYLAAHPVKDGESIQGLKGEPGEPGRMLFVDLTLGLCRYAGDSGWLPIEECSQ
jgi:hypothetical protein